MATRIVENLQINAQPNEIKNWIKRLKAGIDMELFRVSGKLPEDTTLAAQMVETLKLNMLIANIGGPGLGELASLTAPDEPETLPFDELIKLLEDHLAPKPNAISEVYKFNMINQESGESIASFFTRLKLAAQTCDFGNRYDAMIRNRLICGLRNSKIREDLLSCADTDTASDVYKLAWTKEMDRSAGNGMSQVSGHQSVNHVDRRKQGQSNNTRPKSFQKNEKSGTVCGKCTLRGHVAEKCKVKCRNCQRIGHIASNCRSKKGKSKVHAVSAQGSDSGELLSGQYVDQDSANLYSVTVCHSKSSVKESYSTPSVHSYTTPPSSDTTQDRAYDSSDTPPSSDTILETVSNFTTSVTNCDLKESDYQNNMMQIESTNSTPNSVHNDVNIDFIDCNHTYTPIVGVRPKPMLNLLINGKYVQMEVDTGAAVSCISSEVFKRLDLSGCVVSGCDVTLCVANGQKLKSVRKAIVSVKYKDVKRVLQLYIVDSAFPTLLGLEWIQSLFGKDWFDRLTDVPCSVNSVQTREKLIEEIKTSKIFEPGMGVITGYKANIDLKPEAKPVFCKFRQPAFAHMEAIGRKIDQLESEGILVKVESSEYASPVMPVIKPDGDVRLCGDYKRSLNPNIDTAVYPLPVIEDCLWNVRGGELFTKLDIKAAYNHVPVREEDQILLTINTHKGLYKFTRLPYGVCSASAIFQSIMDSVLRDIPGVTCRVDDILVTGKDDAEHFRNLRLVVDRLEKTGFRCRTDKTQFLMEEVVYLGHRISKHGIRPVESKVETIVQAPYPKSREHLISFLGMVQYYARYLPNLHNVIEPLNRLRSKSVTWQFDEKEKSAFDNLKKLISSDQVLTFYDPELPLRLDCDASAVGIGAVLSHVINGVDKPIEFISRMLKPAERNYSQIEREALAIVWAIKRLHRYLYARHFTLCTDHRPLEMIFDPYKSLSEAVSTRIQRWGIFLTSYRYKVEFRPTGKHANADMCSRFPLEKEIPELEDHDDIFRVDASYSILSVILGDDKPLLNAKLIAKLTRTDPVLSKVMRYVLEGWPQLEMRKDKLPRGVFEEKAGIKCMRKDKLPPGKCNENIQMEGQVNSNENTEMRAFKLKAHELSVDSGCLLWGARVVIPERMREKVLEMMHATHMGISSMKALARSHVWWPGIDSEIERVTKKCEACSLNQRLPNRAVPHPWVKPTGPWMRVHADFAGPFLGYMWLLIVDAYSKWLEVHKMSIGMTKASDTIKVLRSVFCRYGIPVTCVTDGGPQFIADEMEAFMKSNGINHVKSPPYMPASNGQIEVLVGKFKAAMKKMKHSNQNIMLNLQNWLLSYHNTPHSVTGVEPAVLMMGRRARTALSLLHPLDSPSETQKPARFKEREFTSGDKVLYWNVLKKTWTPGVITELEGSRVFKIQSENGVVRKHLNHMVRDNTDMQKLPPPPGEDSKPSELVVSDETSTDKPRNVVCPGIKPTVTIDKEHIHKPSLPLPVPDEQTTSNPLPVIPDVPSPSISKPEPVPNNDRPRRTTRQPDRLGYTKLGGS